MVTDLTLEAMRRSAMRLLALTMIALAIATVAEAAAMTLTDSWLSILLALGLPAYPIILAITGKTDATARMLVTITLTAQPALMLFVFKGMSWQIDLHMLFFACLAASAFLCDWKALIGGTLVVAVHHLLLGMLVPEWVFLNGGGLPRILFHAVVLLTEAAALVLLTRQTMALILAVETETAAERDAIASASETERLTKASEMQSVIATLSDSLKSMADGDLTREIGTSFPPAYAAIRGDYNTALQSLRSLVGAVIQAADAIQAGSSDIADAASNLASRTQVDSETIQQTSVAIRRMDEGLVATAAGAECVVRRADEAIATVHGSRAVADQVVAAMKRVAGSAKGIDDVIEGLDKIAFQTRVLAMNAAVEAGRAGEAGRGFAVVADLVSALAMRAEEEAQRARDQLSVTQSEIITAVGAVENVDSALAQASDDVGQMHKLVSDMAADNQRQASAIGEITTAMAAMEESTRQNAAMVEQASSTAAQLGLEVDALADTAGQFQLTSDPLAPLQRPAGESLH